MADVVVNTLVSNEASVARVEVKLAGFDRSFTGAAKKHPNDTPQNVVGEALALSRALAKMAEELQGFAERTNALAAHRKQLADAFSDRFSF